MKLTIIISLIFIISACKQSSHEQGCYIDVINDVTDQHILRPQAQSILELFNLSENKNEGANFRYSEIRDLHLVPFTTFYLPDESVTEGMNKKNEPLFREKIILNFYDSIKKTLSNANVKPDSSFLNHSECFRSVSNELTVLAQDKSAKRILIVFSNLFENAIINVYSRGTKHLLYKNPDEIKKIFQNTHLLPDRLTGITTVFVYEPENRENDQLFNAMIGIYKSLLLERGAKVIIQANNTHYTL
jgi:hypothetical protein